jgi:hypothetical protein
MHFLRTQKGFPNLALIREAMSACRAEADAMRPTTELLPAVAEIEADGPCDPFRAAKIQGRHPWYNPAASMAENLALCRSYRDAQGAPPVFQPGAFAG